MSTQSLRALLAAAQELLDQRDNRQTWDDYMREHDRLHVGMSEGPVRAAACYQEILKLDPPDLDHGTMPPSKAMYRQITPAETYLGMMAGIDLGTDPEVDAAVNSFCKTGGLPSSVTGLEAIGKLVAHYCPAGETITDAFPLSPLQARWAQHLAQTLGLPPHEFQRRLRQPAAVLAPVLGVDVSAFDPPTPADPIPPDHQLSAPDLGPNLHHAPELSYLQNAGIPVPESSGPVIPTPRRTRQAASWVDELERLESEGIDVALGLLR